MKARIIHTNFYSSERVLNLSSKARWLFMYYLTCSSIGLTGAFKCSNSKTLFETGLRQDELEKASNELHGAQLVFFLDDWVVIPGTEAKTGYKTGSPITVKAYEREFEALPEGVKQILDTPAKEYDTPGIPLPRGIYTPRNKKSEIRNKKQGDKSVREGDEKNPLNNSAQQVLRKWNEVFGTRFSNTATIADNLAFWLNSYSLEEILLAVENAKTHPFWRDKITPTVMFRQRNPRGESVDYVGEMLSQQTKKRKIVDPLVLASLLEERQ